MTACGECYGCGMRNCCDYPVESALEAAERAELAAWGATQLQDQEDRVVVQIAALQAYCEEQAGHELGEVAARRLRVAHKLLQQLRYE